MTTEAGIHNHLFVNMDYGFRRGAKPEVTVRS